MARKIKVRHIGGGKYVKGSVARAKLHQRGRTHLKADGLRKAKPVGKRWSDITGKPYVEKRANRSDKGFTKKLGWL